MKQQINLYQPIFRKQQIVFSAQTILWLAVGFLVLLLLWSLLISQRISRLEAEYDRQVAAEQRAIVQLTELQRSMPPSEPSPELEQQVEQLELQLANLRDSLDALDRRLPAAEVDLGARLDALARQVPAGLWLTRLDLADNGQHLMLHGRALSARLVPAYLDALTEEPLLTGMGFRRIQVTAADDHIPGVRFIISTAEEDQP